MKRMRRRDIKADNYCRCVTCGYNHHQRCVVNGIGNTLSAGRKCKTYVYEPLECTTRLFPWFIPAVLSASTSVIIVLVFRLLSTR